MKISALAHPISVKHGLNAFVGLIEDAVRQHATDKFDYYSPFFIPWRFDDDAHIIFAKGHTLRKC